MTFMDRDAAVFSLKCFVAAMLAYYIALQIGLPRPYWAVTTSYIVAQPLAGAVLSKAVFRLMGTVLGAIAAVVLVPSFVNEPAVLVVALSLWLGLCLYISLLDRTPRAYVFLLAGYTASIIGIPSVEVPGTIFTTAILRVQEITLGILCASLIHGLVLPRTVTAQLLRRVDAVLRDARGWTIASLAGARDDDLDRRRRHVALDILELHLLSIHLPFDTARLLPRVRTVRALQDRVSMLLPLAKTVEDRLAELQTCEGGVPAAIAALVRRVERWIEEDLPTHHRSTDGRALMAEAERLEPTPPLDAGAGLLWVMMLQLNLLSRLSELIQTLLDCHDLRDQIWSPSTRAITPRVDALLASAGRRMLHFDRGLALRSALGTFATIALGSTFWIATAWPGGGGAVLIAGIACALFGNLDDPSPAVTRMQIGSTIGLVMAIVYGYAILPRVTDYVTLAAVVAPMLLLMGALMGTPRTATIGTGMVIGFPQSVGFNATYQSEFPAAINGAIAQFIGIGFAMVTLRLFQTIGTERSAVRLLRAGWRDVARRARGGLSENDAWFSRMLDRVGLLISREAGRDDDAGVLVRDALTGLRIGLVAGELRKLAPRATPAEKATIDASLSGVARFFTALSSARAKDPPPALLRDIDEAVGAFAGNPDPARRREGLVLLTSLRRNLYPLAPPYGEVAA